MTKQYLYVFSRALLFFFLLPLLVVACSGGSSDPFSTPTPTPTGTPAITLTPRGVILDGGSVPTGSGAGTPNPTPPPPTATPEEVRSYRVKGESNNVSFTGLICSLEKTFSIDATFPGGSARTVFTPIHLLEGETDTSGGGEGCTQTGSGRYVIALGEDGYGTITWSESGTLVCPDISNSRSVTFQLALIPAPELICP